MKKKVVSRVEPIIKKKQKKKTNKKQSKGVIRQSRTTMPQLELDTIPIKPENSS